MRQMEALTVGMLLLAFADAYVTAEWFHIPIWVTFIAWASFFILGGGTDGWTRSVVSNIVGIILGSLTLLAIELTPDNVFLNSIFVGVGSAAMVQAAKWELISKLPAIVWGYASLVGTRFVTDVPVLTPDLISHPTAVCIVAMVTGACLGFVHELIANGLTKKTS